MIAGKIKILYLIATMDVGGAEKQLIELVRGLNKDKYEPVVCCLAKGGSLEDELREARIRYFILWKRFKFDFSVIPKLMKLIKREKVDILHTHMFTSNSFGRSAGILAKVPRIIISEHGVDIWKNRFHFFIDRILLHWTDRVICVSNGVKNFYADRIGINEDKAITIYNCVTVTTGEITNVDEIRNRYGLRVGDRVIGTIGRLAVGKGLEHLIHAVAIALKRTPQIKLLIIGDGAQRKKLTDLAEKLDIDRRVIFAGLQKDVRPFLQTMEIFVFPSLSEGLGVAVLEAMAFEKPVIAMKIPAVDEVVVDGETGLLIPPANPERLAGAVIELLHDREKTERMGIAGRKRVEKHFNPDLMIKKHEDVYDMQIITRDEEGILHRRQ